MLFYCSCSRPVLHSFPTRRSSDLDPWWNLLGVGQEIVEQPVHQLDGIGLGRAVLANTVELVNGLLEDRKSTRLNSSHLGISYAVFCLKKKKIKNTLTNAMKIITSY